MPRDPDRIIARLSLEEKIGQLWMAGICAGESVETARENFERYRFGGLMFSANFQRFVRARTFLPCGVSRNRPLAEVAGFLDEVRRAGREITGLPVIIGSDQEGGMHFTAFRRREATILPPPLGLGRIGRPADAALAAGIAAREAKALGLDMLYGPCLDVLVNPRNTEVGSRSFGADPELAAALGAEFVRAYGEAGVIAAAKHFPGRGRGRADAHHELEVIDAGRDELEAAELAPFRRAIAAGVPAVMLAHTVYSALDRERPASLSPAVVDGCLRRELGFAGVALTDTLSMMAIADNYDVPEACVLALEAGVDIFFLKDPPRYPAAQAAVKAAVESGRLGEERLDESVRRVLALKERYGLFDRAPFDPAALGRAVGTPEHRRAAADLARRSLAPLKGEGWPRPGPETPVLAVVVRDLDVIQANDESRDHEMLPRALARHYSRVARVVVDAATTEFQAAEAVGRARNAGLVVLLVGGAGLTPELAALAASLAETGAPLAAVVAAAPAAADGLPAAARAVACTFGLGEHQMEAAAAWLAGRQEPVV